MKNVLVYNIIDEKRRFDDDVLFNYFKSQIENSLRFGWHKDDLIIGTNFEFEYEGVKNILLKNICDYNVFNNKWYGLLELMVGGYLDDDFWFHDQDSWQINEFDFPNFEGEIAGTTYVYTKEWNTCSLFFKKTSKNIIKYIVDFMEMNVDLRKMMYSDENYIAALRNGSDISSYLTTINNKYNVGLTHMEMRYESAEKPICSIGFQPHVQKSWNAFVEGKNQLGVKLVDNALISIFKNHDLIPM